jgi:hypothetical protein
MTPRKSSRPPSADRAALAALVHEVDDARPGGGPLGCRGEFFEIGHERVGAAVQACALAFGLQSGHEEPAAAQGRRTDTQSLIHHSDLREQA